MYAEDELPNSALVVQSSFRGRSKFTCPPSVVTCIGSSPSSPICILSPEAEVHLILDGFLFSNRVEYPCGTNNPAVFPVSTTISPLNPPAGSLPFGPVIDRAKTLSVGRIQFPVSAVEVSSMNFSTANTGFCSSLFLLVPTLRTYSNTC